MNKVHTQALRSEGSGVLLVETGAIFLLASAFVEAGTPHFSHNQSVLVKQI